MEQAAARPWARDRAPTGDEAAIVGRMLAGDEAAFTLMVERHQAGLLRFARLFVGSHATAEEIVQDTWLAVLKGLPSFEGRSTFKSWVFSILANRAKTRAVRDKRMLTFSELSASSGDDGPVVDAERFAPDGAWSVPPAAWNDATPETLLLGRETRALVVRTIDGLPPSQRAVVTLRDVEGLEAAEVCETLAISEANQRVLLHRGRGKVRAALERHLAQR